MIARLPAAGNGSAADDRPQHRDITDDFLTLAYQAIDD
jgi:hypothetical protein